MISFLEPQRADTRTFVELLSFPASFSFDSLAGASQIGLQGWNTAPSAKRWRWHKSFWNRRRLIGWRWANGLRVRSSQVRCITRSQVIWWWHLQLGCIPSTPLWESSGHGPSPCRISLSEIRETVCHLAAGASNFTACMTASPPRSLLYQTLSEHLSSPIRVPSVSRSDDIPPQHDVGNPNLHEAFCFAEFLKSSWLQMASYTDDFILFRTKSLHALHCGTRKQHLHFFILDSLEC